MNTQAINLSSRGRKAARVQWRWNLQLLFSSIGILLLSATGLFLASRYRTSQVALQLSQLAAQAHDEGDFEREIKWLSQLVAIENNSKESMVQLAFATSNHAKTIEKREAARIAITQAIAAMDSVRDESTIAQLRRELIKHLSEMGPSWVNEVQRQIILLNAPPGDPQSTLWLAQCLYTQAKVGEWRSKNEGKFLRDQGYWNWLATHPVGFVLEQAVEKNPDSIELAADLLDCYFSRPDLFSDQGGNDSNAPSRQKGAALLMRLKEVEHGLAQWKCYSCEASINPIDAKEFLASIAPKAMKRLQSSNYDEGTSIFWDMQIVLTHANQLATDSDYPGAITWYRQLLAINQEAIPVKLLENLYVGMGQTLFNSEKTEDALAILKEGCKRVGKTHGLAIFDTYAAYACANAAPGEAINALHELNEAIDAQAFKSKNSSALRGEARTNEQSRINLIKWHAEVIRAGLEWRMGNSPAAIAKLTAAVSSQLQIPSHLRVEASSMLARSYMDMQAWDLAARTFDEALALAPSDRALRFQAAKASERAGVFSRAAEHWKVLDDGSFESSLYILQSLIATQRIIPASRRDRRIVEEALEQAKLRLSREKKGGASPKGEWIFDWLELSVAAPHVDFERRLTSLMHKYPDNGELLAFVITEFVSMNNRRMVTEGMSLLEQIREQNPSLWLKECLKRAIESRDLELVADLVNRNLDERGRAKDELFEIVVSAFENLGRPADLWKIMRPYVENLNESVLFTVGLVLIDLERDVTAIADASHPVEAGWSVTTDLDRLIERLSSIEGDSGILALFLRASRLLERFVRTNASEDLQACTALHTKIERKRPRWSQSIALGGRIAAAQGNPEKAIECFRKAIKEGDNRIATALDLVRQLNRLERYEEAEFAFERIDGLMGQGIPSSELRTAYSSRRVKSDHAIEMARAEVNSRPGDSTAWLTLSQAIQIRLLEANMDDLRLIDEADQAIDKAIELTGGVESQLWLYKIRFASRYRGLDLAKEVVNKLLNSTAPEKNRLLLSAQSLLQLREMDRAKEIIDTALARNPDDVEFNLALVEYYRSVGNQNEVVATLRKTVQLAPTRVDIKNSLALALVTNDLDSQSLPWDQIASLVGVEDKAAAEKNKLFHAILLASRGDAQRMAQARNILNELIDHADSKVANDALRYSIVMDQKLWKARISEGDERRSRELAIEIQRQFDRLAKQRFPSATDLVQYVDFLLQAEKSDDIPWILDRLESLGGITPQTLALRIRLAHLKNEPDRVRAIIAQSIEYEHGKNRTVRINALSEILAQQGLKGDSLFLLKTAYEKDPAFLRALVDRLMNQGEFHEGLEVCLERAKIDNSPELVSLIADAWAGTSQWDSKAETIEPILERGLEDYPSNAMILESIGSLRLSQFRYKEAFQLLDSANRISPDSLLTLNNLAIAASEIPGKESMGIALIKRAIAKYGRIPDVIDSLGLVQLQVGSYSDARTSFDEAFELRPDPRFRLHRVQVDWAESAEVDLDKLAHLLDLASLKSMRLTPREQAAMAQITVLLEKRLQVNH